MALNILKRYEGDDFDESYTYDDAEYIEEGGSSKPFLVKAIAMIIAVTGIAYGANIALTPGGSSSVEFGQGFKALTACDTHDGITITPLVGYINETGTGKFSLDGIILNNVDAECVGKDFIIQVWADTGTALTISESATSVNVYKQFNAARFYFQDSATAVMTDAQYTDVDVAFDPDTTDFVDNKTEIQISFDPDRVLSFADASDIRKITIQTLAHSS